LFIFRIAECCVFNVSFFSDLKAQGSDIYKYKKVKPLGLPKEFTEVLEHEKNNKMDVARH
jgi:hypothetical protein